MNINKLIISITLLIVLTINNTYAKTDHLQEIFTKQAKSHISLLFFQHAQSADIKIDWPHCYNLILHEVEKKILYFSDQPNRIVGHADNQYFIKLWQENSAQQPNTIIEGKYERAGKTETLNFVGTLSQPRYDNSAHEMFYHVCATDVNTEQVRLPLKLVNINLFIDSFNDVGHT